MATTHSRWFSQPTTTWKAMASMNAENTSPRPKPAKRRTRSLLDVAGRAGRVVRSWMYAVFSGSKGAGREKFAITPGLCPAGEQEASSDRVGASPVEQGGAEAPRFAGELRRYRTSRRRTAVWFIGARQQARG